MPEYNARAFTADGFYRSGDLMRQHPSGNYVVEGRKKDLINRGGEKISAEEIENLILIAPGGAERRLRAGARPEPRREDVRLRDPEAGTRSSRFDELVDFLKDKEIAKFKLPERLLICDDFPVSTFGKVSKKAARLGRPWRDANEMRIIDLHCYPGTKEWIDCQGPYVEALAQVLEARLGRRSPRTR